MATFVNVGDKRINLDNVLHVDVLYSECVEVYYRDQTCDTLNGEQAVAFLYVIDHHAIDAMKWWADYVKEKAGKDF